MGTIERAMERARRGGRSTADKAARGQAGAHGATGAAAAGMSAAPHEPAGAESAGLASTGAGDARVAAPSACSADIDLDFALLREQGMLTPDSDQHLLHEQYRLLKRALIGHAFSGRNIGGNPANLIQVTSSVAREGKTFTAFNTGMSMAMEVDYTALLVDADLTERSLTRLADLGGRPGLTEILEGKVADPGEVIYRPNVERLAILPAGRGHPRAAELVASDAMRRLASELANRYPDRVILFDSTPLCMDSQAATLARHMGQVVVVVEAARTAASVVKEGTGLLDQSAGRVGLLLNKSPRGYGYSYYGGY